MATATKEKTKVTPMFTVTMEGSYFAVNNGDKVMKPYKVKFKMTKEILDITAPTAFFKHNVAGFIMPRLYSDYPSNNGSSLATFCVTDAECNVDGLLDSEIRLMNRDMLCRYIQNSDLPVETWLYNDDDALRQAIMDYRKEPETFNRNQKVRVNKEEKLHDSSRKINMRKLAEEAFTVDEILELNGIPLSTRAKKTKLNLEDL